MSKFPPFLYLFVAVSLLVSSCKSSDPTPACVAPAIEKNLVGSWTVKSGSKTAPVTFKADGTYVDDQSALVGITGSTSTKTWKAGVGPNNTSILDFTAKATDPKASPSEVTIFTTVTTNECNNIVLTLALFGSVTLTRN
jgi:hypothetical protein